MSERTEEEREQLELSRQLGRFKSFVAVKGQKPAPVSSIYLNGDRIEIFSDKLDEMIEQLAREEPEEEDDSYSETVWEVKEHYRKRFDELRKAVAQFLSHQGQDLCHDRRKELAEAAGVYLPDLKPDTYENFCEGCDAYQRQLYGKCRTEDVLHDLGRELWEAEKVLGEAMGWRGSLKELAKEVAARCEDYEFLLVKLSEAEEKLVSASSVEQIEAVARALGEDGELLRIALRGLRKEAGQVSEEEEEQEEPASQLSVDQRLDQISDRLQDIGNELSDLRLEDQGRGREGISWARRLVEMAEQMAYAEAGQIRRGQGRSA